MLIFVNSGVLVNSAPYKNVISDYGAVANAVRLLDGSISSTSNTTTLTCASGAFVAGDVGKSIGIQGAGSGGTNLITTIATRSSATVVTISTPALTTVTNAHVVYGTDSTTAFQNAINYAYTNNFSGTVVRVPIGQYFIAGPMLDPSGANAQVTFPASVQANPQFTIYLVGDIPQNYSVWSLASTSISSGSVIHSMTSSAGNGWTGAAIFGGGINGGSVQPGAALTFRCENILFRTYPNPSIGAINGQNINCMYVDGCTADTGIADVSQTIQPTHTQATAFAYPQTDSPNWQYCGLVNATGYYTGFRCFEYMSALKMMAFVCWYGVDLPTTWHASQYDMIGTELCKIGIFGSGTSTVGQSYFPSDHTARGITIKMHDIEHDAGSSQWYSFSNGGTTGYDLSDPSNLLYGRVDALPIQVASGFDSYIVNGASNMIKTTL